MAKAKEKIPVFDIHIASFLELNNISPQLTLQGSRVIFELDSSDEVYRLLRRYQENPEIPILDFVNVLRRLRSRMLAMRDSDHVNEKSQRKSECDPDGRYNS